jgi:multidrug resistance efflux pump
MSRRSTVISIVLLLVVIAAAIGLYANAAAAAAPRAIVLAGDVRAEEYVVRAPVVTTPTVDFTVGIPTTATAAPKRPTGAPASRGPVVSGFLTEVPVALGAHVATGEVLARLDTKLLDLGVTSAKAAATRARADLKVLENTTSKLEDARAKLVTAKKQLITARASLTATIALLVTQKASLEASITAIQAIIAHLGPVPPYPAILAGLQTGLGQLTAGLAGARTGLSAMNQGLAKIASGFSQMDKALQQLRGAHRLLEVNIKTKDIAVRLAEARIPAATITSPVSGVVTFTRLAGTAVMVGAPIVRIRPDGPSRIDTYLTTDQLVQVKVGDPATVDFDSNPGSPLSGHIAVIDDAAVVPPTSFPTSIVHMTRAVRVTIELDPGLTAPPGTPVDIEIPTGSAS